MNLAPAHVRKAGPSFDLAIAVGLLAASGQVPRRDLDRYALCGELSLSGELQPVSGSAQRRAGRPARGLRPPAGPGGERARGGARRGDRGERDPDAVSARRPAPRPLDARARRSRRSPSPPTRARDGPDLADVRGQEDAKRALEIAAAGGHNLLMVGPPGRRQDDARPPPARRSSRRRASRRRSRSRGCTAPPGLGTGALARRAAVPRAAPHDLRAGLVGGGSRPMPGEITLAHRGVLFLDELPEFARGAVDALREPLEEGRVEITRGQRTLDFPANAIVVAAACNRCPCAAPSRTAAPARHWSWRATSAG